MSEGKESHQHHKDNFNSTRGGMIAKVSKKVVEKLRTSTVMDSTATMASELDEARQNLNQVTSTHYYHHSHFQFELTLDVLSATCRNTASPYPSDSHLTRNVTLAIPALSSCKF